MHSEFINKENNSILEYLEVLGKKSSVYSERREGLGPLFPQNVFYVYATEKEIALILIDSGSGNRYAEKDDMAWDLAVTCELFRNRFLRLSKHVPHIFGVLVTADYVVDEKEMESVWETLDISVIGSVYGLEHLSLPVNTDEELSIAFPLIFLYEAEFTEADYAYAEYSLLSLTDPDISPDERDEEMNYLREEFGLEEMA